MRLALEGKAGAQRFKREGAILARLAHPHIAQLLDAGVTAGGQPYLVIENVAGEPINHFCDSRLLDVEARVVKSNTRAVMVIAGPSDSSRLGSALRQEGFCGRLLGGPWVARREFPRNADTGAEGILFPLLEDDSPAL